MINMMSEYYDKESLINVLKLHLLPEVAETVNWNAVIEDGEIYPYSVNGIDGCYIYEVKTINGGVTVFVHPIICTEVYYDGWTPKDVYMNRAEGEIW